MAGVERPGQIRLMHVVGAATAEPRLATRPAFAWRLWRPRTQGCGARSVEEIALRRTGAERHATPSVPAPAHRERIRVEQVRVADAEVSGIAHVVRVDADFLGYEGKRVRQAFRRAFLRGADRAEDDGAAFVHRLGRRRCEVTGHARHRAGNRYEHP